MEFGVLGPVRLSRSGADLPVPTGIRGTLFALLLASPNELVPVDVLVEALWPGSPDDRAPQRLQLHVSRLRRLVDDPGRLAFEHGGYRLRVEPGELDSTRFTALVDEAAAVADTESDRCAALVRTGLDLWRGLPFGGADVPLLAAEAGRLNELRLFAVELRYEAELRLGRQAAIVGELAELVAANPLRERLHALLMTALYRAGRQAEALAAFRTARRVLVDELGLEPGPELRAVERQILDGEPVTVVAARREQVPAQLPPEPRGFVGRDRELSELDSAVASGERVCVVAGTAGAGKTALALRWAHRVRDRFPDGELFVDLRGYDPEQPVTAHEALAGLLDALGISGAAIPPEPDARAARFRTLVDGRRLLLLLDNVATVDQVRPLLPGAASVFVLVTSRQALPGLAARDGASRLDLDRLPVDDARRLLGELVRTRQDTESGAADVLIELCARLPLALRVAAELVNSRPGAGIAELTAEVADAQDALDLLDVDGDDQASVRAVFSWSYQGLAADAARLFRHHGLHTGRDLDAHALAALAGTDPRSIRRPIEVLTRGNLLERSAAGRFRSHDLLRAYAVELATASETADERRAAQMRLFTYYLHTAARAMDLVIPHEAVIRPRLAEPGVTLPVFADEDQARGWLDRERPNLVAAARHPSAVAPTRMAAVIWRFLLFGGHFDDAEVVQTAALDAARCDGDQVAEGDALRMIGLIARYLGQTDRALRLTEEALDVHTRADYAYGQAAALSNLGDVRLRLGRLRDGIALHERAVEQFELAGLPEMGLASINATGNTYRWLGDHERALEHLRHGLAVADRFGNWSDRGYLLRDLGMVHLDLGAHTAAAEHLQTALGMAEERDMRSLRGEVIQNLGTLHFRRGEHAQARAAHTEALTTAATVGDPCLRAEALNGLARLDRAEGAPAEALPRNTEALALATRTEDLFEQAHSHQGLGDTHHLLGDDQSAREHWRAALAVYEDMGVPDAEQVRARLSG